MTVDYARLTRDCTTQNQFNSVHIEIERRITPLDFSALAATALAGDLPEPAKVWAERWLDYMPSLRTAPEPYLARNAGPFLTWLRPPRSGGTRYRTLITFCGASDRLMMPLPVFLQIPPAAEWDVLKVVRPYHLTSGIEGGTVATLKASVQALTKGTRHRSYMRAGMEIRDLEKVFSAVRSAIGDTPPSDLVCLGSSAGGVAALLAALRLGARRCIVVGGNLPDAVIPHLPALTAPNPEPRTEITYLYGADHRSDPKNAERLRQQFGGTHAAIAGIRPHNVLASLHERGELISTLNTLLDGRPLPAGMTNNER